MTLVSKNAVALEEPVLAPSESAGRGYRPCTAELAPCTCPELCERDHEND